MTTPQPISDLPQDLIRDDTAREFLWAAFMASRARWFSRDRPDESIRMVAECCEEDLVEFLAREGFTPNWMLSYHYQGEDANLVRFWYEPDSEYPFRQDHVRLFIDEFPRGEVGVSAHTEASALVHRGPHIHEKTFDWVEGITRTRDALENHDVELRLTETDDD
ncbi:hypothetical protein [Natronoglomus mannanivorans]|uniref:Uncharacterized protein n=1 Tax=Natronoglomus mannanivorans TaxID=2979990 RepID=A0AAP3E3Z3_9EURY|nr:hypothetical protein [Halobacteria archaeon AArc-xg1-1]